MKSAKSLLETFANTNDEVHALGYGLSAGFLGGLTWGTNVQFLGVTVVSAVVSTALGLKALEQINNVSVVQELNKEPQYACGAIVGGFLLGIAVQLVTKYLL